MQRLRFVSVLGLFTIMVGMPFGVAAQTPVDLQTSGVVTDIEGEELGIISVEEAEDDFEGYAPGWEPVEEVRYVLLTVIFEATGELPFEANPGRLVLRAADGFHWLPYHFAREDENPPELQAQTMSPGNRISGVVGFQVPKGVDLDSVYYQPESSRLILISQLSDDPAPAPVLEDEVEYTSVAVEGAEGIVIVSDLEDPFEGLPEGVVPAEDARYLIMSVSFEATGDQPFDASPSALLLRDTEGFLWSYTSVPREDSTLPELQSQTLSPGNRISGIVGFQIPEDAELAELFWQPESGRLIRLVDFLAEDGAPLSR
jgi:hypothetical protein